MPLFPFLVLCSGLLLGAKILCEILIDSNKKKKVVLLFGLCTACTVGVSPQRSRGQPFSKPSMEEGSFSRGFGGSSLIFGGTTGIPLCDRVGGVEGSAEMA